MRAKSLVTACLNCRPSGTRCAAIHASKQLCNGPRRPHLKSSCSLVDYLAFELKGVRAGPQHRRNSNSIEMSASENLKEGMNKNLTADNPGWNVSRWFAVLSPLIGIALGFALAALASV